VRVHYLEGIPTMSPNWKAVLLIFVTAAALYIIIAVNIKAQQP
jgi:hypothetical protein